MRTAISNIVLAKLELPNFKQDNSTPKISIYLFTCNFHTIQSLAYPVNFWFLAFGWDLLR